MHKILLLILSCLLLAGCGSVNAYRFKSETAKALDNACFAEEVIIVNQTSYNWSYGWYAMCKGKMYHCIVAPDVECTPSKEPKKITSHY